MKIAYIDTNNKLLGWYDRDIHTTIPTPNIEITDSQWQVAINSNHNKVNEDGTTELFDFRTLEEKKQAKISQLKANTNYEESVLANGVYYKGGYDSAQKLDSKRRLVIESGGSTVQFIDENDEIQSLTLDEAKTVCLAVANDYETKFYKHKVKKKEIESCTTIEELEAITI